tara:strand:+ start:211 stop:999 length:789 start_codon:yes stop_codon:yes gene_type:complete
MRSKRAAPANGVVLYKGPSALDGKPIVAIATCLVNPSKNDKTGPMAQLIIMREDIHPVEATKTGEDESICGTCPARKANDNWCYVLVGKPISQVYRAYKNGRYAEGSTDDILKSRWSFRHGTYGNPSAIPFEVNEEIFTTLEAARKSWTAYEHEWRTCDQRLSQYSMASCETIEDAQEAISMGWRPYLSCLPEEVELAKELGLLQCPYRLHDASTPQCSDCNMCSGNASKVSAGIVAPVHGANYKVNNYVEMRERASLRVVQ